MGTNARLVDVPHSTRLVLVHDLLQAVEVPRHDLDGSFVVPGRFEDLGPTQ